MTTEATVATRQTGGLGGLFDRVDGMLRPEAEGGFSANEAPVTAAIRAAGRLFGQKPQQGIAPSANEPIGEAVQRIARSAGLIARETTLAPDWQATTALPIVGTRRSTGAPVALIPRAGGWRWVDGSTPRKPVALDAEVAADIDTRAWIVGPALPDTEMSSFDLLKYGFSVKTGDLLVYALMSTLAGIALAWVPIANFAATDIVIPGRDLTLLYHIGALMIALMLASLATRLSAALCQLRIDGKVGSMLRAAAADRMIRQSRAFDAKPMSPASAALVARSVEAWHKGVWSLGLTVVSGVLVALPSLVAMTVVAPLAALLSLVTMLVAIGIAAFVAQRQIATVFSGPASPTSWISLSYEALSQLVTVRSLGAERHLYRNFAESCLSLKDRSLISDRMGAWVHALKAGLEAAVVAIGLATIMIFNRDLSAQDSVAFTMATMTVAGAAVTVIGGFGQAMGLGMTQRMIETVLKTVPQPAIAGAQPGKLTGAISARGLVVRHHKNAPAVLAGIDMDIEAGQHIGIVGPSGSGKSTLLNALLGLVPLESGRVAYNGMDLAMLDSASVRRQIGVVGQAGRLFSGSILDNITAGLSITQDEAWAALDTASLAAEVKAMPLGLSTPIGDAEAVLSTGQVQRLLIARAVAHKPSILILDEATSALDPVNEARVAAAMAATKATVISVAHRLDTVKHCDRIYVIDGGRIVESGTYDELVRGKGAMAAMVAAEQRATGVAAPTAAPMQTAKAQPQQPAKAAPHTSLTQQQALDKLEALRREMEKG